MLDESIKSRLKNAGVAAKVAKTLFITFFSAAAGFAQFAGFGAEGPTTWQLVGITATVFVFIGGVYTAWADKDAADELLAAKKAIEEAQELASQWRNYDHKLNILQGDLERATNLYLSLHAMRAALERAIFSSSDAELAVTKLLFSACEENLKRALGFEMNQHWTVGVYRAERQPGGKHVLVLVEQDRAIKCDISRARQWPEGTGVAGMAFANCKEIIVDDARNVTVQAVLAPGNGLEERGDWDKYVSFAAVPILVGEDELPWGVAIATSDSPGHFSLEEQCGVQPAEAIRGLAGMVALGVATARKFSQLKDTRENGECLQCQNDGSVNP